MINIRYVSGWRKRDPKIEADVIAVWRERGILPPDTAPEDRAKQICAVAYDGKKVCGISTVEIASYAPLRNKRFGFLRVFTLPDYSQQTVAIGLATECREILRAWSVANPGERLAGMAAVYQSPKLGHYPIGESGLTLIGYTREGYQMRVIWFNHLPLNEAAATTSGAIVA
ncbi:MAG: hypothetical protein CVT72_03010 [Alphaproteobacteria bacterium HGW-Alphaproteobacteria-11]|nr:MAG: hypothetical protein CVT72_03010 [Alphaproteobacteria bacterium HGW-Alphaproteobacteria-11]